MDKNREGICTQINSYKIEKYTNTRTTIVTKKHINTHLHKHRYTKQTIRKVKKNTNKNALNHKKI